MRKSGPVNSVRARPTGELRGAARWLAMALVVNVALGMAFSVIALRVEEGTGFAPCRQRGQAVVWA